MTTVAKSPWLVFAERAFSFNFIAFSFVMFSCLFPTGFSASFSTLAFIFAIPLFFRSLDHKRSFLFEKIGLLLFAWLCVSVLWSQVGFFESLMYLSEYRIYFVVPVFAGSLIFLPNTRKLSVYAAVLGAIIALVASYGLGLGWWKLEGADLSLANQIYHGFVISSLLLVSLLIAREVGGGYRALAIFIAVLSAYNVLNVETGRTGYFQIFAVGITFTLLSIKRLRGAFVAFFAFGAVVFLAYITMDKFSHRVNETLINVERMVMDNNYHSSAGTRLEFYRGALNIASDNPFGGVGVGDVVSELEKRLEAGQIRAVTDNVHNEFLNMLVAGGIPALLLYVGFIAAILWVGFFARKDNKIIGDALIGVGMILACSSLFNSTIKDYGEKHALMIMLSLLAAKLFAGTRDVRKKTGSSFSAR